MILRAIACPVPYGWGELTEPTYGDGTPHPVQARSFQELVPVLGVLGVLGGLQA